ncbi:uncharacterized protein RMCB_2047 [Mycolicibacterium brisbanense]|uniref:Uncharacterized protein n=1 Tax=Mycolicibacterium brisbanense TaxID=146020 RepID=A0A100VXX6_9MYCO|nr:uncharacterized protein RMCB_2047 [Mycolicibacterium brisbanense]
MEFLDVTELREMFFVVGELFCEFFVPLGHGASSWQGGGRYSRTIEPYWSVVLPFDWKIVHIKEAIARPS